VRRFSVVPAKAAPAQLMKRVDRKIASFERIVARVGIAAILIRVTGARA
jgi:hypothetical protein